MKPNEIDRVIIFNTTLRDGEQFPDAMMNPRKKLEVARQLVQRTVGVMVSVHQIAGTIKGPTICALAPGRRLRIHTFSSGSDIYLEKMRRMTRVQNIAR